MLIYNKLKQVKVDKIKETNDNDIVIEISESKEEEDFTAMTE